MSSLERLRQGGAVFGLMQTYPLVPLSELVVWSGYDFVIIDSEHGVADERAQLDVLAVIAGSTSFSLVRVRAHDESAVARYLDFGADGVIVPDVRTPEQAEQIAFAARKRWTGGLRGDRYGPTAASTPKKPLIIVLIESPEGVANVEAILNRDGIDGVIIGTGDLSTHLGTPGDFTAPAYLAAVDRVERAVRTHGKIIGAKPDSNSSIPALFERGYRLFILGRDLPLFKQILGQTLAAASSQVSRS